ncbi:acetyl-CoA synthetase-like protein [Coniophora puteana RWD-64-598 SS2]|uniref:Acetyl-CoA synthetase-like protein n=1 Tax=Coniophora puteana (strain RWD-64-598) TaxID=741705 RepID=A0A5M3MNN5_CONPW|nr:acetyl-CoA synthetase-like protein [Coniophora puteana RWD-64-598 SS2]EIW80241.1 acetyl-CoA synthetase-like protein [Coniophora puteana RWD-64-598 SS2]
MADHNTERIYPPLDHSLLLYEVVDFHIDNNPTVPIYVYPDDQSPDGVTHISFLEFGRAVHRAAHILRPGREGPEGEVIALIANVDTLLYQAIVVGMMKAGIVPFPMSPRNSAPAVIDMMKKTSCTRILTLSHTHSELLHAIDTERASQSLQPATTTEIPTLAQLFPHLGHETSSHPFTQHPGPYPPPNARPDVDTPAMYMHSSGSTGFPKPIAHTFRIQIQWLAQRRFYTHSGARLYPGEPDAAVSARRRLGTMALPAFHSFGYAFQVYAPLGGMVSVGLFAPTSMQDPGKAPVIPTSDSLLDAIVRTRSTVVLTVPAFVEQWAESREAVDALKRMEYVLYGGGPLPTKTGDSLSAQGVPIASELGATEFGCPVALPDKQDLADGDWVWMRFSPHVSIRWVPQSQSGERDAGFECVFLGIDVGGGQSNEKITLAVENLPEEHGYATSDVWIEHPTKKGLWKVIGRVDDVLTLATGEKTVPGPMEDVLAAHPRIGGAVMFGRARHQVGVLVEPRGAYAFDVRDERALAGFRNAIWDAVETANKNAPAFSRIFKEMILVASPEKPLPRAPKGTVLKKRALQAYEAEIAALYEEVERSTHSAIGVPDQWTQETLEDWLGKQAALVSARTVGRDADFFAQGFDSLTATYLRNRIIGALRTDTDANVRTRAAQSVPQNIVFQNPTIRQLAGAVVRIAASAAPNSAAVTSASGDLPALVEKELEEEKTRRVKAIEAMIEKYTQDLTGPAAGAARDVIPLSGQNKATVLLTGSTGGLGSHLLAHLLVDERVERVYAFNRPAASAGAGKTSLERQTAAFLDKDLAAALLASEKLKFVEGVLAEEKLGLGESVYDELRNSVTHIIHAAWRLDFNLALSSFEPHVRGTRNLVDLALAASSSSSSSAPARVLFTSSIGSTKSWDKSKGAYPEEVLLDAATAVGNGYGESKYVAERVLSKSGLTTTSVRIGQIAGGPNGAWATSDWVPILIKSGIALGALPDALGVVSWLPTRTVAAALIDAAFAPVAHPALNLVHPRPAPWQTVFGHMRTALATKAKRSVPELQLPFVPFSEWHALLARRAAACEGTGDLDAIPAIKLQGYFAALAKADEDLRAASNDGVRADSGVGEAGGSATLSTEKFQSVSEALRGVEPLGREDAEAWVGYWASKGYI